MVNFFSKLLLSAVLFSFVTSSAYAQELKSVQVTDSLQYKEVKINCNTNLFDCPVLTPRLQKAAVKQYDAKKIVVSPDNTSLTFLTTNKAVNQDSVKTLLTKCHIPLTVLKEIAIKDLRLLKKNLE